MIQSGNIQTVFPVRNIDTRQSIYHDEAEWDALWKLNKEVALAYDLGVEDFDHILSTFPGLVRKRPAFYAFLQERVADWKAEK